MDYLLTLLTLFAIYGMLALTLDLVIGYTGLLSLAHAAFYGIGAYALALGTTKLGLSFGAAILMGLAINGLFAWGIGIFLNRFKEDYYAIASAGFTVIIFSVLLNWRKLTEGPVGIFGISRPEIAVSSSAFAILCVVVLGAVYGINYWLTESSFGRVLKGIREDERLLQTMGYDTETYKQIAFVGSAVLATLPGALFASYLMFIDPSTFTLHESIYILTIIIVGGLSNLRGALLGSVVLISLPEILRFLGLPSETAAQLQQLIYGGLLVGMMFWRPQGLLGKFRL